ncbi:MAG: caspase family protein [Bacteroidetes bacterium]|nr:caspase family protein [Bacteroidota bacterium]
MAISKRLFRHFQWSVCWLLLCLVFAACKLPSPEKKKVPRIKHNYIVLLDLSDRLIVQQNQPERDKEIIKSLYGLFEEKVRKDLYIKSRDEIKVVIAPQVGSGVKRDVFEDRLYINMQNLNNVARKAQEDQRRKKFFANLDTLYRRAVFSRKPTDYNGADIWKYFHEDLKNDYSRDSLTKNYLFILTDGYPIVGHQNKLWLVKNEFPDLEIVLLEAAPRELDLEWDHIMNTWEEWFNTMGIERYTFVKRGSISKEVEKVRNIVEWKETKSKSIMPAEMNMVPLRKEASPPPKLDEDMMAMYKNEKRYALVIGNSTYKNVPVLRNPVHDASDLSSVLKQLNFEVISLTDATYIEIRSAFLKFHEKLVNGTKDQTIGLFYFSGHGLQNDGENYLVPVDARIEYQDDIPRQCFPVQKIILENMERSNTRMNILILDACRNNTFPQISRAPGNGLAEMRKARGSFIAFSTSPGSTASDGIGRNGLYTQELLKAIQKPNRSLEQVFKEVRINVLRLSGERQYTWDNSNITGDFYFNLNTNKIQEEDLE